MNKPPQLIKLYQNIGNQIRKARIDLNITLEELGEKTDKNWSYLSQIERARSVPSIETLFLIAESLRIPLPSLFKISTPGSFEIKEPAPCYNNDPYGNKILYLMQDVPPRDKKIAIQILRRLFKKKPPPLSRKQNPPRRSRGAK